MSNFWIAFLIGSGGGAWVGNWFYKRTGGNTAKAIGGGAIAGMLSILIILTILWQLG